MLLTAWKTRGARLCLVGCLLTTLNTQAFGMWIESELLVHRSRDEAGQTLIRELAAEQLVALGVSYAAAKVMIEVTLSEVGLPTDAASIDPEGLVSASQAVCRALRARGLDPAGEAALAIGGLLKEVGVSDAALRQQAMLGLGCSTAETQALSEWLTADELQWLQAQGAEAFAHAGKVVGLNFTGLLILLIPLTIAVIVAAAAGQSAASVALGALAVGVLFVLLVEPRFLFGERGAKE